MEPISIEQHPWFTAWTEPNSGIVSYVLNRLPTPMARPIYHTVLDTNPELTRLWFWGLRPPSKSYVVCSAHLTPEGGTIRAYETCLGVNQGSSPLISPDGRSAEVAIDNALYRLDAETGALEELLVTPALGPGLFRNLATHLTKSCDGRYRVFDTKIGNRVVIWRQDTATGEHKVLYDGLQNFHHTLCSPCDPNWILLGQGPDNDPVSGHYVAQHWRAWLMAIDGSRFEMVLPDQWCGGPYGCGHEFWAADGTIYYCNQQDGVFEAGKPEEPRSRKHLWKRPITHARCLPDRELFVGDTDPYGWTSHNQTCSVYAFSTQTGKEIAIATALPFPRGIPMRNKRAYHFDPHPHFSADGRYVIWATTVLGEIGIAFTPVEALRSALEG